MVIVHSYVSLPEGIVYSIKHSIPILISQSHDYPVHCRSYLIHPYPYEKSTVRTKDFQKRFGNHLGICENEATRPTRLPPVGRNPSRWVIESQIKSCWFLGESSNWWIFHSCLRTPFSVPFGVVLYVMSFLSRLHKQHISPQRDSISRRFLESRAYDIPMWPMPLKKKPLKMVVLFTAHLPSGKLT